MTSNDQSVKWHSDECDITFQIVIFLEMFVGKSFFEFEDPTGAYTIQIPIILGTIIVFDRTFATSKNCNGKFLWGTIYCYFF